eukprot:9305798-Pyramimonas_sp.AAC.1
MESLRLPSDFEFSVRLSCSCRAWDDSDVGEVEVVAAMLGETAACPLCVSAPREPLESATSEGSQKACPSLVWSISPVHVRDSKVVS